MKTKKKARGTTAMVTAILLSSVAGIAFTLLDANGGPPSDTACGAVAPVGRVSPSAGTIVASPP